MRSHSHDHHHPDGLSHCGGHEHGHSHAPKVTQNNIRRVGLAAILTGLFMIAEIIGGVVSGSLALIADAGHMFTDFVALALAWLAFRISARAPNERYSFGYNRVPVLIAFVNGLSLCLVAVWIVIEAVQRFSDPGEILAMPMLVIAGLGLVVNLVVFKILSGADQHNFNVRGAMLHVLGDLLGSIGAILAAIIILLTNWTLADPILSILVAVLILRSAILLVKETAHVLVQAVPKKFDINAIQDDVLNRFPSIGSISDMRIWSMSHDEYVMTFKIHENGENAEISTNDQIRAYLSETYSIHQITIEMC